MEQNINYNNNGVSINEDVQPQPVLNPIIPSGEQTVWADVSSLLASASNGNNFFLICTSQI